MQFSFEKPDSGPCLVCSQPISCGDQLEVASCWCAGKPCATKGEEAESCLNGGLCQRCLTGATYSPCMGTCFLSESTNECVGCLRTPEEIRSWIHLKEADRRAVYLRIFEKRQGS